jgi:transcriptional regulator with XRE-family HTH domain
MDMKMLGRRLHLSRLDLSLQQKEVAAIAGISNTYLSELENGKAKTVTLERLTPLAKALNVSVAYLLGETADPLLGQADDQLSEEEVFSLKETSAPYAVRRAMVAEDRLLSLLRMLGPGQVEEVGGSNPLSPTTPQKEAIVHMCGGFFVCICEAVAKLETDSL